MSKLTKKEIYENIKSIPSSKIFTDRKYVCTVRGFMFESYKDNLYEIDETGHCTFVDKIYKGKKGVVDSIFQWFQEYAPQELI